MVQAARIAFGAALAELDSVITFSSRSKSLVYGNEWFCDLPSRRLGCTPSAHAPFELSVRRFFKSSSIIRNFLGSFHNVPWDVSIDITIASFYL